MSIMINASPGRVWDALTNPEIIRQYLWGTEAVSDWQVGGPITYRGTWKGQPYEDRGTILALEPERLLVTTYLSSMAGLPDAPENYNKITYALSPVGNGTRLTVIQDNVPTDEARAQSEDNWRQVLDALKGLLEK